MVLIIIDIVVLYFILICSFYARDSLFQAVCNMCYVLKVRGEVVYAVCVRLNVLIYFH